MKLGYKLSLRIMRACLTEDARGNGHSSTVRAPMQVHVCGYFVFARDQLLV